VIVFDTNVLIYGFDRKSPYYGWARDLIAEAVSGDGGCINAVSLADNSVCGNRRSPAASEYMTKSDS